MASCASGTSWHGLVRLSRRHTEVGSRDEVGNRTPVRGRDRGVTGAAEGEFSRQRLLRGGVLTVLRFALHGWDVDLAVAHEAAVAWCAEVDAARHSEIAAVPAQRLAETEAPLLAALPSLQPTGVFGRRRELRKVDKLSCIRFASARCYRGTTRPYRRLRPARMPDLVAVSE